MEWLEVAARSVDDAKEIALDRLGVHESEAEFMILNEGKINLFGRVKEEARIRARILPTPVRAKTGRNKSGRSARPSSPRQHKEVSDRKTQAGANQVARNTNKTHDGNDKDSMNTSSKESSLAARASKPEISGDGKNVPFKGSDLSLSEQADIAESFVRSIAEIVDLELEFTRSEVKNNIMRIEASGEGIGLLIGHRGATARAIDDLVRTVLQRSGGTTRHGKIRIDVGSVQARRKVALTSFVEDVASEVIESGEEVRLEPMNRYDRRIVHAVVARISGIASCSKGNDPMRYVIISEKPEVSDKH